MIALSKCSWVVKVYHGWFWEAWTEDDMGLIIHVLPSEREFKSKVEAIENWKEFAKLNKMKKWQIVIAIPERA